MKMSHVKLIAALAEEGSLTAAGKKLFLSQPALSRQLKEIESQYGAVFFQRVGKKMVLTELGKRAVSAAENILREVASFERDVKRLSGKESGTLRIAVSCYTCYYWLPALLQSYNHQFPKVEIQIVAKAIDDPIQSLLEGDLDVAIVPVKQANRDMICRNLFTDNLVVVVSDDHHWNGRKHIDPDDFASEHLIMYPKPITAVQHLLKAHGVTPAKISRFQLTEARVEMVKAGLGVTVLANWAVKPYLESGRLSTIPLTKNGLKRTWYAAYLKNNKPWFAEPFTEHLRTHLVSG